MMWMLFATVALLVVAAAAALAFAIMRLGHEIPRAVEALDALGREMRPALIRVTAAADDARTRSPRR